MSKPVQPKGCWVRFIELDRTNVTVPRATVHYACYGTGPDLYQERRRARAMRGVTRIAHRGIHISGTSGGKVRADFTLIPAAATCRRDGSTITCRMHGDTSSPSLSGAKRRRKRTR